MTSARELKGRINSVHSSHKITGAMKMISSARLRKAENILYNARPYREQLNNLLSCVTSSISDYYSPLGQERNIQRVAIVLFTSNEGLCGAFNLTLFKKFLETVSGYLQQDVKDIVVYVLGNKLQGDVNKIKGIRVKPVPVSFKEKEYAKACVELSDELMRDFLAERVDRVDLIYSRYKSIGNQLVTSECFLPWKYQVKGEDAAQRKSTVTYIYEPDAKSILDTLYPLVIHSTMYRALMENQTSEQAARILSMQVANDNARKLLADLQLQYNKIRQQAITTELLDIVGGSLE